MNRDDRQALKVGAALALLALLLRRKRFPFERGSGISVDVQATGGAARGSAHGESHDNPGPASRPE